MWEAMDREYRLACSIRETDGKEDLQKRVEKCKHLKDYMFTTNQFSI